jgi:MFS family permease
MTSALMATEIFHKGAGEYGILGTTMAVGSLTGALLAARRGRPRHRLVIGSAVAFGLAEIVAGMMPTYLAFLVMTPAIGVFAITMANAANATVQLSVSPMMRGRVMALYMMIFMGGTPLGAPVVGWVGQTFGARWTLLGGGAATIAGTALAVLLFARSKGLFGARRGAVEPAAQPSDLPPLDAPPARSQTHPSGMSSDRIAAFSSAPVGAASRTASARE